MIVLEYLYLYLCFNYHINNMMVYYFSNKDRNFNIIELLCANCNRWYHESCIGYQLGKLVPFMTNYIFVCKNCSPTGLESFKKNPASKFFPLAQFYFINLI